MVFRDRIACTVSFRCARRIALQLKLGAPAENAGRRPGQERGRIAHLNELDTSSKEPMSSRFPRTLLKISVLFLCKINDWRVLDEYYFDGQSVHEEQNSIHMVHKISIYWANRDTTNHHANMQRFWCMGERFLICHNKTLEANFSAIQALYIFRIKQRLRFVP